MLKVIWSLTEGGKLLGLQVQFYLLVGCILVDLQHQMKSSSSETKLKRKSRRRKPKKCTRKCTYWECILNENLHSVQVGRKVIKLSKYQAKEWGYNWNYNEIMESLSHKVIHDPIVHYGMYFHEFFKHIDPLAVVKIARGDIIDTKKEKRRKNRIYLMALEGAERYFNHPVVSPRRVYLNRKPGQMIPVVFDTGASVSISPVKEDFIGEIHPVENETIKGLAHEIQVAGYGRVRWIIRDIFGNDMTIETNAICIPEGDVRLFSPQSYFQEHRKGTMIVDHTGATFTSPLNSTQSFLFPNDIHANIPMGFLNPSFEYGIEFGSFTSTDVKTVMSKEQQQFLSVAHETNQNLTRAQKELLQWHWKLGHAGFTWVQQLLRSKRNGMEPIIEPKLTAASTCPAPLCAACLLARQTRLGAGVSTEIKDPDSEMSLKVDHLLPGQAVSMDHYQSTIKGRLEHTFGKEKDDDKYSGGTIFVDHATTTIYIQHQVSLKAGETVVSKRMFEQDCKQHGVHVQHYHADNGVFDTQEFMDKINKHEQTIDFSGVGAKHQNGVAERAIRTVTEWARAMLLHAALHWSEQARIDTWPFAMDYAVYLYNNMPKRDLRISPLELFTNTKLDHTHLR